MIKIKKIINLISTKRLKIALIIFLSFPLSFLMLAGLSYGFYQNRYLDNHNKNLSIQEVATENIDASVAIKPEENKPIVDTSISKEGLRGRFSLEHEICDKS